MLINVMFIAIISYANKNANISSLKLLTETSVRFKMRTNIPERTFLGGQYDELVKEKYAHYIISDNDD